MRRLPMYSGDPTSAIASLSVCYVNTDGECNFHEKRKSEIYNRAWRTAAPAWCRSPPANDDEPVPTVPLLYGDRVGVSASVCRARPAAPTPPSAACRWTA
jgi:hypothetical protein